jgi:hypothetical protein
MGAVAASILSDQEVKRYTPAEHSEDVYPAEHSEDVVVVVVVVVASPPPIGVCGAR